MDALCRRVEAVAACSEDVSQFAAAVLEALRPVVPFDGACLAALDPATMMMTAGYLVGFDSACYPTFFEIEFLRDDLVKFTDLAREPLPAATLHDAAAGDLMRSARYRELLRPDGFADELRVVFRSGESCWGTASLARAPGRVFSRAEVAAVAAVSRAVADGLRRVALATTEKHSADERLRGPAVLVLDSDGAVEAASPQAEAYLELIDSPPVPSGGIALPAVLYGVAIRQRTTPGSVARARLRAGDGSWLVIHAGPLTRSDGAAKTVVTIEPARPPEIVDLLAGAMGLTNRESQVLEHVLAGRGSDEIGRRLCISPHTVQDHLKKVFEKAGVRRRKELVARLLFEHHRTAPSPPPIHARQRPQESLRTVPDPPRPRG